MTTKRREWPNAARNARDEAAQLIQEAVGTLQPLGDDDVVLREEVQIRAARSQALLERALRWLESVGANTRP